MFTTTSTLRSLAITGVGTALEWFDFALYVAFSKQIGAAFFGLDTPENVRLQYTNAILAVSFIGRIIGATVIGRIGDKFGRIFALQVSLSLMSAPSFLLGVFPGYDTIGVAAPIAHRSGVAPTITISLSIRTVRRSVHFCLRDRRARKSGN
jgi:MHS family proline/betaine transporter-like MFS transporter